MPRIVPFCYFSSSLLYVQSYYMPFGKWEKKQIVSWKLILCWMIIAILVLPHCWWNSAESFGSCTICSRRDHHRHIPSAWKPLSLESKACVRVFRAMLTSFCTFEHQMMICNCAAAGGNQLSFLWCRLPLSYMTIWTRPKLPASPAQYFKQWIPTE